MCCVSSPRYGRLDRRRLGVCGNGCGPCSGGPWPTGFMETNPAGEAIDGALPPMPKVKAHLRALPYQEVGAALEVVEASQASVAAKLCFRFLVLTAARSGEARGATWDEIDLQGKVWRVPAHRMKAGMEHRVPLSGQVPRCPQ